jgi:predicted secreted protein
MVSAKQYRQFEGRVPTLGLKQRANEAERDIKLGFCGSRSSASCQVFASWSY